jgi:Piwi domain
LKLENIDEIQNAIKVFDANYNPKILYILVNKNNITRFFKTTNGEDINPKEGTVV